jgi:flagellin-like protein
MEQRAQSAVIGVALLMVITVVSIGVLTAGTGLLVDEAGRNADAQRVADRLLAGYEPRTLLGATTISLPVTGGHLYTVPRTIEVHRFGDPVATFETAAIRYQRAGHRVSASGQALVQGRGPDARFLRRPALVTVLEAEGQRVLSISVVRIESDIDHGVDRPGSLALSLVATHERRELDPGRYTLSLETDEPVLWERALGQVAKWTRVQETDTPGQYRIVAEIGRVDQVRLLVTHLEVRIDG